MTERPVLFIDNQDSFVWNLVDYVSQFYEKTLVASNRIKLQEVKMLAPLGIVISPGPGHPARERDIGNCIRIIRQFRDIPILGVCLGHQAINLAYGGSIRRVTPLHGKATGIMHDGSGIFRNLKSPLVGGRYHSLAVERVAPELRVSALTSDGVVMGLRHEKYPVNGLQFHPESVLTPDGKRIISNWLEDVVGCTM